MSIVVRNIVKRFGAFTALDDVSVEFPQGRLIALLGPSGCGKTTLLRIIAGLEWPDSGRVLLGDQDASDRHVRERRVGFVFQHYALFRHMSVFENVAFGLRVKPRASRPSEGQIRKRVGDLLDLVQLSWLAGRYPTQLSGGQRQRVALARALAVEPRVLLLDEPFGALDAKVRKELRSWLRGLHDQLNLTSIFVTHDQDEALEVADRIVLMNKGRVEQEGRAQEVYEHPATAFAYSFLGAVNQFPGYLRGAHLDLKGDRVPVEAVGVADGEKAIGYARPHELRLLPTSSRADGLTGQIQRILVSGPVVRVEIVGDKVLNGSGREPRFEVELSRHEAQQMELAAGQAVKVCLPPLKVFPEAAH
jgi:sulfate transport system ATP-binding protein